MTHGRIVRNYNGKRWIACRLTFRDWHREQLMQPGRFTELFFLDEATAFAAGHRPCALCRRADYVRFLELLGEPGADAADARLHEERLELPARTRRLHDAAIDELPDGAFVLSDGAPHLVVGTKLLQWTPGGYVTARPRRTEVSLITPPSLVVRPADAAGDGEVPLLHPSAAAR